MKSSRRVRRGGGSYGFYAALAAISISGIALVAVSKAGVDTSDEFPRANIDHWHAALGVYVCDNWMEPAGEFHNRADNANLQAGLHSHGDGLIHMHPYSGDESGDRATIGRYFKHGGWKIGPKSFQWYDGVKHENGDSCPGTDKKGVVRWAVNGEEQTSNPSEYRPQDQDTVAIYFVDKDADLDAIGDPPSKANLENPVDEPSPSSDSTAPGETTVPGDATGPTAVTGTTTSPSSAPGDSSSTPTAAETTAPPSETSSASASTAATAAPSTAP